MFSIEKLKATFKPFQYPSRQSEKYMDIENFKDYELFYCFAYELAIRNSEIKKELNNYIEYYYKVQENPTITYDKNTEKFDFNKLYAFGFDDFSIKYYMFREEANKFDELENLLHQDLCDMCQNEIDYPGTVPVNFISVVNLFNKNFIGGSIHQGISFQLNGYDNPISEKLIFCNGFYDDNGIYRDDKGLYSTNANDLFERTPIDIKKQKNIMTTLSLTYCRPSLKPLSNHHQTFININLNHSLEKNQAILKQIYQIQNIRKESNLIDELIKAADLFFASEEENDQKLQNPIKRKKNLQIYFATVIWIYDVKQLFSAFRGRLKKIKEAALKEINSENNRFHTDANDRRQQREDLSIWYKEQNSIVNLDLKLYDHLFDKEPNRSSQINDIRTIANKLIEKKRYLSLL